MIAALVAALSLSLALAALLFWQTKRAAKHVDWYIEGLKKTSGLNVLIAAAKVAMADKENALNEAIADRDKRGDLIESLTKQRNDLLNESLENSTPETMALAVRAALEQLQAIQQPEATEALPYVPSG